MIYWVVLLNQMSKKCLDIASNRNLNLSHIIIPICFLHSQIFIKERCMLKIYGTKYRMSVKAGKVTGC